MKVTKDQIEDLFSFVRKHHVEHYDLQTELVDHLANGIEGQWQEYPERSFKDARLREFRKFGIGGFDKVVSKRRNAMAKRYRKIILRFYKEYFKLPKVVLTFGSVFGFTLLFKIVPSLYRFDVILFFWFALAGTLICVQLKKQNNNELEMVKYGKKWMLKDQIYSYGNIANIVNFLPITLNIGYFRNLISVDNIWVLFGFAFLTVCIFILSYITIFVIPQKAEELLAETYPEYKIT